MKGRVFLMLLAAAFLAAGLYAWPRRDALLERGLEAWLNRAFGRLWEGPVDLEGVHLASARRAAAGAQRTAPLRSRPGPSGSKIPSPA
jgi:hypothetical protein